MLGGAEDSVADTKTVILEGAVRKYFYIFQYAFQELPDHFKQCASDIRMKKDFVLIDPTYNVCRALERQASDYDFFGEDDIAEMVRICDNYLKLGGHPHMFCSPVQLYSWVKAVFVSTESVVFQGLEGNEQLRGEALFDQENQKRSFVTDRRKYNWNPSDKKPLSRQHVWAGSALLGERLGSRSFFLNFEVWHSKVIRLGFPPNTNVSLGALKLSFAESVFDMVCLVGVFGSGLLLRSVQNSVSAEDAPEQEFLCSRGDSSGLLYGNAVNF